MDLANDNLVFDLGTKHLKVYKKGECVKDLYSYKYKDNELVFFIYDSMLTNLTDLSALLRAEIKPVYHGILGSYKPEFYAISLLKDCTNDTEMKRHRDLFKMLRCSSSLLLPTVFANMIGFNLHLLDNEYHMLTDIGAGTTTFTVVKNGAIIKNKVVNKGGNSITNIFKLNIRRSSSISLNHIEAEEVKLDYFNKVISNSFISADYCRKCDENIVSIPEQKINEEIELFNLEIENELRSFILSLDSNIANLVTKNHMYVSGHGRLSPNLLNRLNNVIKLSDESYLPNDITATGIKKIQENVNLFRPYLIC